MGKLYNTDANDAVGALIACKAKGASMLGSRLAMFVIGATVFIESFGGSGQSIVAQEKIDPKVRLEAQTRGASRVIVALRRPSAGAPPTFAAAQPQQYLVTALSGTAARNVNGIADLPLAVAELSPASLDLLAADPNVLLVVKDEPMAIALVDSVALIGLPSVWQEGFGGQGQVVAVLDSGIDRGHQAFKDKIADEACFSTPASTVYSLKSLCPNGLDVMTTSGAAAACNAAVKGCDHGTHVAGIAAGASMTHDGKKVEGVAHQAKLFPIQVFTLFNDATVCGSLVPCIRSFPSDQIRALAHVRNASETHAIASVNLSVGGGYYRKRCDEQNTIYTDVIDELHERDIAVVIASGNDKHYDGISQPACFSRAVAVTATTKPIAAKPEAIDTSYANVSQDVDLAAPGTDIVSAVIGSTGFKSGTSMAAPHVSGAYAVLKSYKPEAGVDEIQAVLRATGKPLKDQRTGVEVRRIAVDAALAQLKLGEPAFAMETAAAGVGTPPVIPEGARQVVIVPGPADPLAGMSEQEVEERLKAVDSGEAAPTADVVVQKRILGGQNSFVIEAPAGLSGDVLRRLLSPGSRIFDNTPKPSSDGSPLQGPTGN